MTKAVAIGKYDSIHILPKPSGAVLWFRDQRIEVDQFELIALTTALAEAAAPEEAVA